MQHISLEVAEESSVGAVRREAMRLARSLAFPEEAAARVGIVATEMATNLWKHAGGGEMLVGAHGEAAEALVELVALDRGPGMADAAASSRDGVSTAGSAGTGLGAVARQSALMDVHSEVGAGTVVVARVGRGRRREVGTPARAPAVGGVCVPLRGEEISGDAWSWLPAERGVWRLLVADGLGHGVLAAEASRAAVRVFAERRSAPAEAIRALHAALRPTRGAAVAVAEIDCGRAVVRFCGVGNVAAVIVDGGRRERSLVSHHGTAGHDARRIQEFSAPFGPGALLVLHTDGLGSQWDLSKHPGLLARHPLTIAAVLYREHRRERDDVTVVAFRGPG